MNIIHGDCIKEMSKLPPESIDLVFADPPFNIGKDYDEYDDEMPSGSYKSWSEEWIEEVWRKLSLRGSFWLAIGDEYAAELKCLADDLGFALRSWVIWHYTFGVNCANKFTRSHTHLLYFVKDPKNFTFNPDAIKVPSARQTKYNDKRAKPGGRLPFDVWTIPRVCGTYKERVGWHPCQMPLTVMDRIVLACSNPGDVVLDPFLGSGTTGVSAVRNGREFIGIEMSKTYCTKAEARIKKEHP